MLFASLRLVKEPHLSAGPWLWCRLSFLCRNKPNKNTIKEAPHRSTLRSSHTARSALLRQYTPLTQAGLLMATPKADLSSAVKDTRQFHINLKPCCSVKLCSLKTTENRIKEVEHRNKNSHTRPRMLLLPGLARPESSWSDTSWGRAQRKTSQPQMGFGDSHDS